MKNLLIVESPTKARTIGKYLGADFEVLATVGHLRDLPKSKMGVDLKHDFEIDYQIDAEKKKVVSSLISAAAKAQNIYLATDPDREGEAIAWHVDWILKNPETVRKSAKSKKEIKTSRISFHEITKAAVEEALLNAREVDMNLVDAQQGRRVLDRVVGYSLSPVLWKKVRRGLSAGRVQSVALRLIVEREKEIEKFVREKFFKVWVDLGFRADLFKVDDKSAYISDKIKLFDGEYSYTKSIFSTREEVDKFVGELTMDFVVSNLNERETTRHPLPPYTTSKLQQAGGRRFGWSGKQTMTLAQRLYERGLITYHRTDSVNLSVKAIEDFRKYISKEFGIDYVAEKVRVFKNTSKNAQEAHEAIRPTSVANKSPDGLDAKELKLYQLIWKRAVATQAASAKLKNTTAIFTNGRAQFKSIGVSMLFDGFLKIAEEKFEEEVLPLMKEGEVIKSQKVTVEESETNPPPRYSDASLVQSLEKQGIGRPSTYASIISTILSRQYVERDEGKYHPTALGVAVVEFLVKNFLNIVSLPFTAEMEEELDQVAMGKVNW
ncbi:MAG: type I DNA topoisomerase, partial [Candidatus Shapirobacteria bacterium]